jgi:hypothetical protein
MSVPLILDIGWGEIEGPIRHDTTASQLFEQAFTVGAKLCIGPVFASYLKTIIPKSIRYVAVVLVDLLGQRFHFEDPAAASGEGAAKLVVVRIVNRIIAVASVYHTIDKVALAI